MAKNLFNNWVKETSNTVGTGAITLTGSLGVNQTRFREAIAPGSVYYSIESGADRECGIGEFNGTNRITRSVITSTISGGVFNDIDPSPITLVGTAVIFCTMNADLMASVLSDISAVQSAVSDVTSSLAAHEAAPSGAHSADAISVTPSGGLSSNVQTSLEALDAAVSAHTADAEGAHLASAITYDPAGNHLDAITAQAAIDELADDHAFLDDDVSYREVSITALEGGGSIAQNGNTAILVATGHGEVINSYDDPEEQATEEISWVEQTFDLLSNGGMPAVTGIGVTTIGVQSAGAGAATIRAFPNGVSASQRRVTIVLGIVEYVDRVITDVTFAPVVSNQLGNVLMDLIDYIDLDKRVKGMLLRPTTIGDLSVWRDSGQLFHVGINYGVSRSDQNTVQVASDGAIDTSTPFSLVSYNNGSTGLGATVSLIPNDSFEPDGAGTITPVSNNHAVIHYMLESLGGKRYLSYAQQEYLDMPTALNNLFADRAAHNFAPEFSKMIIMGQIVVLKNATIWSGTTAEIYPLGSSTSSGSSGGAASQAVNISYSDTFNLGANVQSAIDTLAGLKLTPDQHAAINAASAPSAANPFLTLADVSGSTGIDAGFLDGKDSLAFLHADGSVPLTGDQPVDPGVTFDGRDVSVDGSKLDGIASGATGDQVASGVPFTPTGNIAATNVQTALAEIETDYEAADTALGSRIDAAVQLTGRNILDNGDFQVWQRGKFDTSTGAKFFADRWSILQNGGNMQQINVPEASSGFGARVIVAGQTGSRSFQQSIELNKDGTQGQFAVGRDITFSGWVRSSVAGSDLSVDLQYSDDRFYVNVVQVMEVIIEGFFVAADTWYRFEETVTISAVPVVTNRTLRAMVAGSHGISTTLAFDVHDLQVEMGAVATAFDTVSKAEQMDRCSRFCVVYDQYTQIAYGGSGNGSFAGVMAIPTTMRTTPTIEQASSDYTMHVNGQGIPATLTNFSYIDSSLKINMEAPGSPVNHAAVIRNNAGKMIISCEYH